MKRWLPAILLTLLFIGFRALGASFSHAFPNFQPLPALLLCGLIFLSGRQRWLIPAVWLVSDPLVSLLQNRPVLGWHHLAILAGLGATLIISHFVRKKPTAGVVLAGSAVAAVAFYVLTNLVSFATDPLYAKTIEGFWQSQWFGPPNYGPTWVFLRNLVAANLLFSGLFLLARAPFSAHNNTPSPALAKPR